MPYCIEDFFWWHRRMPKDYSEIQPLLSGMARVERGVEDDVRGCTASWTVTDSTGPDEAYGGSLSVVDITITMPSGRHFAYEELIDLRNPDKLWKPHLTYTPPYPPETLAPTDKNIADALADAVFKLGPERAKNATWAELGEQEGLPDGFTQIGADKRYTFEVSSGWIIVKRKGLDHTYRYPLAGPEAVNRLVAPMLPAPSQP